MGKSSLFFSMVVVISLVFTVSCVSKEVEVIETYMETEYKTESYATTESVIVDIISGEDILTHAMLQWNDPRVDFSPPILIPSTWIGKQSLGYYGLWYYVLEIPRHSKCSLVITLRLPPRFRAIRIFNTSEVGYIDRYVYGRYEGDRFQKWLDSANSKLNTTPSLNWVQNENTLTVDTVGIKNLAILLNTDESYGFDNPEAAPSTAGQYQLLPQGPIKENAALDSLPGPIESVKVVWTDEVIETKTVAKEHQIPYQTEKQRTVEKTEKVPIWEVIFGK